MIQNLRLILLYVLITFFSLKGYSSGTGHFSSQGEENYIKLISEIFSVSADRRASKNFINRIEQFWSSPDLSEQIKSYILEVSDNIYTKKGRPYPDYNNYLLTVMAFVEKQHSQDSFNTWHKAILTLLENPSYPLRHGNKLFELTNSLLNDDILYSTAALHWKAHNPNFRFLFSDSLKVEIQAPTTIVCKSRNDSIIVENTLGKVNLMSGLWKGEKGKVTWEQSGLDPNMVYASFGQYEISMSRNRFEVQNVEFHNRHYFNYPLTGFIRHQLMNIRNPENTTFPRFESYEQRYRIDNIYKHFHYEGGFSQHGSKFLGSGTNLNPAIITIFKNDTAFITAKSLHFALRKDQIISNTTEITINLDTGYIYHPGLLFKYMDPIQEIHLIRDGEGISKSPFFNTYHNISMDAELIKWKTNEPFMELRMITGAAENYAFFESISYFREEFFNQIQGMDAIHPLQGLLNCSKRFNDQAFTAKDYAAFLRISENQVRQQIIGLSFHGFIAYNINTDTIEIRDRLKDYLLFRAGRKDYDVIRFRSTTPGNTPNATFDLKNYDLNMNGVSVITISDRQNVALFPKEEQITMKKDRNFNFDGNISAGMINLFGNSFNFNYQDFRIDLKSIDSMSMRFETEGYDYYGRRAQRKVNSTIAQLSGYLEIDSCNNKSGNEEYPEYPKLTSTSNSFVYYDKKDIQDGAYDRESFHFTLDPFQIDSINHLTRDNIEFSGVFTSGIFPDLNEIIKVRPDFSLGFIQNTPENGYPIYDKRANFCKTLDLSNQGLIGDGTLNYLNSSSSSENFIFLPEKTYGLAYVFSVEPQDSGVEYPDVKGNFANINYLPYDDKLRAEIIDEPFTMFQGEANLKGALTISPEGLEADGQLLMPNANLMARKMELGHHSLIADSADFNLISDGMEQDVNFKTTNLLANIDFNTRMGAFTSRDRGSKVEFTQNRYIAFINEFSWDMNTNHIHLGTSGSEGNRFVSTHRRQDSLDFIVPIAKYDIASQRIYASEVKSIKVADTEMLLSDGEVVINKDAVLDTLRSVNIVLNDSLHKFYDANVSIQGKYQFNANGLYDFINGEKAVKTIKFANIYATNNEHKTLAEGNISEREIFTFNRRFAFKGDVELRAGNPLLNFKGGAQMLHDCSSKGPQYYARFESEIDPDNVFIPIAENTQNFEFENIYHHFFLNRDSNIVYSSFLEDRRFHSDAPIISAFGLLGFDDSSNSFVLTDENKFFKPDTIGNILRFHNDGCITTAKGTINMGLDLGHIKTKTSGDIIHYRDNDKVQLNTLFGIDFMLDNRSIEIMTNTIKLGNNDYGNPENEETINRYAEWMGKATAEKVVKEMQGFDPMRSLPADYQYLMTIDGLNWTWNTEARSYLADTIVTLGTIKNEPVNRKVAIKSIISFSRAGNSLDMHIQANDTTYFFFSYRNDVMQTRSSIAEYNTNVQTLGTDERRIRAKAGSGSYTFILASENRMKRLLNEFSDEEIEEMEENDKEENEDMKDINIIEDPKE